MRKSILYLSCFAILMVAACDNSPLIKPSEEQRQTISSESPLDREINSILEKGISMEERKRQIPFIEATFLRLTTPERARHLAALCYTKTLGSPFMPFDLAEIAVAETGNYRLSGSAVSSMGALGVWQLMPVRARSHGYNPLDMKNDEKCAEAAVRELYSKLEMAQGDLEKAKKLYCGQGPQADAYIKKIQRIRHEMQTSLDKPEHLAMEVTTASRFR